ncbi:hypothetical protein XELAEV_18010637mg [Xenopus laevis]|uniref:Uncharacterized protein n=1 Tax=Xenopus laevis TaxID=8355 RepID=A0A974I1Z1_XENLA|nr:hypothetical protein XELAEV_18010637mg [Xenopus laevis]
MVNYLLPTTHRVSNCMDICLGFSIGILDKCHAMLHAEGNPLDGPHSYIFSPKSHIVFAIPKPDLYHSS